MNSYSTVCMQTNQRALAKRTFLGIWKEMLPNIVIMKPMADLCWTCQKNSIPIQRASNLPEEEKSERLVQAESHIASAQEERHFYHEVCKI